MELNNQRYIEIDGIRGWAALSVVLFHFFPETFGVIFPFLHNPIFGFMSDGGLAVFVFFILSGDALSLSFFKTKDDKVITKIILARYFRLTFPIVISCFIVFLLMRFDLTFNAEAGAFVSRRDWLGSFINFEPSLVGFVKYTISDVYFRHSKEASYNPFLWTMSVEFLGSLLIFLNIAIFKYLKKPLTIVVIQLALLLIINKLLSLFLIGFIFGYLRCVGFFDKINSTKSNGYYFYFAVFIITFTFIIRGMSFFIADFSIGNFINNTYCRILLAAALVFTIYSDSNLKIFFSSKLSVFLGEISFPLYVLQFGILVSYTSWFIGYAAKNKWLDDYISLLIPGSSVILCMIAATAFRPIEKVFLKRVNFTIGNLIKN